jgi:hypothetical protein
MKTVMNCSDTKETATTSTRDEDVPAVLTPAWKRKGSATMPHPNGPADGTDES